MSFNFTSVVRARASQLSFDSTVKNCINKSIRCWACLLLLFVFFQLLLLLLLQCHSRIHFIWFHYEHFSAFVDIARAGKSETETKREEERERKKGKCVQRVGGDDALLFITFHTRICVYMRVCVCVCACVHNQTLMSEFNMLYKSFWAIDTFMRSFHIRRNSYRHTDTATVTCTHIHTYIYPCSESNKQVKKVLWNIIIDSAIPYIILKLTSTRLSCCLLKWNLQCVQILNFLTRCWFIADR